MSLCISVQDESSHLYHREDVDEIQPLDLMRLQTMRTLHLREHRHDFLSQSSAERQKHSSQIKSSFTLQ